ncbi:MAG: hypothetical protein PHX34_05255 [Candidatus Shapirobacteria bacterium]|nr:hypothetical protein [Candidatus Shapirobacteria bacterium]
MKTIIIKAIPDIDEPSDIEEDLVGLKFTIEKISKEPRYEIGVNKFEVDDTNLQTVFVILYDTFLEELKKQNEDVYQYFLQPQVKMSHPDGICLRGCCLEI